MRALSLLTSSTSTNNGEVEGKSTMCVIYNTKLKELMKKYPTISFKIIEELSRRYVDICRKVLYRITSNMENKK